jgi:hypothetical protein
LDPAHRTGYGPRMSALIAELSGMQAVSRKSVQQFLSSVLGISISTGAHTENNRPGFGGHRAGIRANRSSGPRGFSRLCRRDQLV